MVLETQNLFTLKFWSTFRHIYNSKKIEKNWSTGKQHQTSLWKVNSIKHHSESIINNWGCVSGRRVLREKGQKIINSNFFIKTVILSTWPHLLCTEYSVWHHNGIWKHRWLLLSQKCLPCHSGERTSQITTEHWLKTTNQQIQVLFKLVCRKAKDKIVIWNISGPRSSLPYLQ